MKGLQTWISDRRQLTSKQLRRAKFTLGATLAMVALQFVLSKAQIMYQYKDQEWSIMTMTYYDRGVISGFANTEEYCDSYLLFNKTIPLFSPGFLFTVYFLILFWLFLGISIISDIFMGAIEKITSERRVILVRDENLQLIPKRVNVWNPTVANLTLMALGSSAPEILLSVLETVQNLGAVPGELGPSTIVGSAAFNLLVISAVSIYSVNADVDQRTDEEVEEDNCPRGVHKIQDLGVFTITAVSSVFSYIWLFMVLVDGEVTPMEAWLTLSFFFIMLIFAYIADKCNQAARKRKIDEKYGKGMTIEDIQAFNLKKKDGGDTNSEKIHPAQRYSAIETVNHLLKKDNNVDSVNHEADQQKSETMKEFLREHFGTDQVQSIDFELLKEKLEGPPLLARIAYRKKAGFLASTKKEIVTKGQIYRAEHASASALANDKRNPLVGFPCLHYSVSEGSGYLMVKVESKTDKPFKCYVKTVDGEATAPEDYEHVEQSFEFTSVGQTCSMKIPVKDDEQWEPDQDFYVIIFDQSTGEQLVGEDTRCRVTIIDDDRPGCLAFQNDAQVKQSACEKECRVKVERLHDFDGEVRVKYRTVQVDKTNNTATPGVDYEHSTGFLVFGNGEASKEIVVTILQRETTEDETRDEIFGIQLYDAEPSAVKISKKDTCIVEIVTDAEAKKQAEALQQLLERINKEENVTWGQQFINACLLHPTKNDDGEIEDISALDAVLHFFSIGWKVIFAIVPPPHMCGGWLCFFFALSMIGGVTAIVGEIANLMGCVVGLKPGVTAITFVAIGTSLPDTFASKKAAEDDRYADSAVGNITGSNSVNVFLGLGLPWVIASIYYQRQDPPINYKVPSKGLDLSVALFLVASLIAIFLIVARRVFLQGELGGSQCGRSVSAIILVTLWVSYVSVCALAQYEVIEF